MTDEQKQKMKEYQKNYREAKKLNKNAPEMIIIIYKNFK